MSKAEKEIEIWKPIQNYEEYMVSNKGRVKRLAYYKKIGKGAKQFWKERIIKPQKRGSGYYHVMLCKNGKHKGFTVHRLVAQAFIPRIEGKDYIDHIDGNRLNNTVSNLRWCSIKENCSFPLARQRMKSSHQKYAMPVIQCDLNGNEIKRYKSMNDATRATGVRSGNISNNCSGYYKTAGGYIWKLANVERNLSVIVQGIVAMNLSQLKVVQVKKLYLITNGSLPTKQGGLWRLQRRK